MTGHPDPKSIPRSTPCLAFNDTKLSVTPEKSTPALPSISRSFRAIYVVILFEVMAIIAHGSYLMRSELVHTANEQAKSVIVALKSSAESSVEALNAANSDDIVQSLMDLGLFSYVAIFDDFDRVQSEIHGDSELSRVSKIAGTLLRVDMTPTHIVTLDTTSTRSGKLVAQVNLDPIVSANLLDLIGLTFLVAAGSTVIFLMVTFGTTKCINSGVDALIEHTETTLALDGFSTASLKRKNLQFKEFDLIACRSQSAANKLRSSMELVFSYRTRQDLLIKSMNAAFNENGLFAAIHDAAGATLFQNYKKVSEAWVYELFSVPFRDHASLLSKLKEMHQLTVVELGADTNTADDENISKQYQLEIGYSAWILIWTHLGSGATFLLLQEITEAREATRTAMHTEKMEALGRIASGVAHEFNNMLSIVISYLDLAKLEARENEVSTEYINTAMRAAERAGAVVSQLKSVSKSYDGQTSAVELGRWQQNMQPMLKMVVGPQISLEFDIEEGLTIEANEAFLDTAIINLCKNAREAINGTGFVRIEARAATKKQRAKCKITVDVPYVAISVIDSGPGFNVKDLGRVAEPFFSTKLLAEGTGLGLSSVYAFAKSDDGGFYASNNDSGGARLTILKKEASRIEIADTPPASVDCFDGILKGKNVFILEDEQNLARSYSLIFKKMAANLTMGHNLASGAKLIDDLHELDIAILDLSLPDGSGSELLPAITDKFPACQVLVASGNSSFFENNFGPMVATLEKPFRLAQLLDICREAVSE